MNAAITLHLVSVLAPQSMIESFAAFGSAVQSIIDKSLIDYLLMQIS